MIIAKVNGKVHKIYVVDGHSHIGYDEDEVSNPNPLAPFGTFDFYKKTYAEVLKSFDATADNPKWSFSARGTTYEFKVVPNPPVYEIFKQAAGSGGPNSKMIEKLENSWMVDFGIAFPFQDKYRAEDPTALYRASNERIASVVTKFPISLRMAGYCRVHPDEGQKAVDEIRHSIQVKGLRGLKLHPRSERWLDHVNSQDAVNCLIEAARHSLPVIFDTRGKKSIYDIHDLLKSTRAYLERNEPHLLPHLKVITGHCAAGNFDDRGTYDAISDNNAYGELSMIRSPEFDKFIIDFKNKSPAGKDWSKHIIFGSDFPYFFERHAKDIISFLLSERFYDQGGTIEDAKNILGRNMLSLLPEYHIPPVQKTAIPNPVAVHAKKNGMKPLQTISQVIVNMIEDRDIEITKFVPMFNGSFTRNNFEYLLETKWKVNGEEKNVLMVCLRMMDGEMMALGPLGEGGTWEKFGFDYFTDSGFKSLEPITNVHEIKEPVTAWKQMKELFTEKKKTKRLKPIRRPMRPMKGPAKPVKGMTKPPR